MKKLHYLTICLLFLRMAAGYGQYCVPSGGFYGCSYGDYIENVSMGTISNPSSCSSNSYGDYISQSTMVVVGTSVTISVSLNPDLDQGIGVFVDWNQDFDLPGSTMWFILLPIIRQHIRCKVREVVIRL